jgi:hypothetical protein
MGKIFHSIMATQAIIRVSCAKGGERKQKNNQKQ